MGRELPTWWRCAAPPTPEEVGRGLPSAIVAASKDQKAAELVQDSLYE